ncbi:hypothetical protein F4777DRAFT_578158 [Nemania sp. FL0916]|nr:hypothetical protein F4777DRAFT_578158 [Nemania sp. FL0916]
MATPSNTVFDNSGNGPQNVVAGGGPQFNHNGSGTQYHFHGSAAVSDAEIRRREKEDCLSSLGFPSLHARWQDIENAHPNTCDWLFSTQEFLHWRGCDHPPHSNGVLWIKGNPGTGKSTLMKHTSRYLENTIPHGLIAAYYFNARGGVLEKTPVGMMRSLVYQILSQDNDLYETLGPSFREQQRLGRGDDLQWRVSELKGLIRSIVRQQQSKPLLLLVDALDECDDQDVRDVVSFFEILSIDAIKSRVVLRICLSSRHYPYVSMKKA